jgi:hypothetical protein
MESQEEARILRISLDHSKLYTYDQTTGGGHFVYNINTKQRNSVPRVIGEEGKGIPMTDTIIKTINNQGSYENQPEGIIFDDLNNLTTILDLDPCADTEDLEIDDDDASDRSYISNDDDSTLSGDHDLPMHDMDDNPDRYYDDPGVGAENDENGPNNADQGVGLKPPLMLKKKTHCSKIYTLSRI